MPTLLPLRCFLVVPTFSLEPLFHFRLLASGCLFVISWFPRVPGFWIVGSMVSCENCPVASYLRSERTPVAALSHDLHRHPLISTVGESSSRSIA